MFTLRRACSLIAFAALALCAEGALARVDVKIDFDEKFDFTQVKTWAWSAAGYGDVKMARTQTDDPEAARQMAEPIIVDAIAAELGKRGLRSAESSAARPDVTVRYYLLLTNNVSAQTVGQFLPGQTAWGLPPFLASTQSLEVMNRGSLVIDLSAGEQVVWRGIAQSNIKMDADNKKRESLIREGVRDLIRRFPPKPRK
jgi:hypothetical protein